jgi:2-keto-4-pentenoate hydratase/2-oxohepta-3-ene-1,7-dioic acid hydratase in catechol pathway
MRIARVLQGSYLAPTVALERDGALYDVETLELRWDTQFSPDRVGSGRGFAGACGAGDFHTRVIALACAGLEQLDERLRAGSRPTEARLLPGSFLWLPPCDVDRCAYLQMAPSTPGSGDDDEEPRYWIGNARGLIGHDTTVPFPPREDEPELELGLAAVLGEDIRRATPEQAEQAILGYTLVNDWTARQQWRRDRARAGGEVRAKDFATQLGPVLVTKSEISDLSALTTRIRVEGDEAQITGALGACRVSIAEAIAYISGHIDLCAGDVIGAGCVATCRVPYGATAKIAIERIGVLAGRPVRGPEPVAWRRRSSAEPR